MHRRCERVGVALFIAFRPLGHGRIDAWNATSRSMSSSMTILSSTRREAAHAGAILDAPSSGVGLMSSGREAVDLGDGIDHDAGGLLGASARTRTTITTVELSGARGSRPNRVRRSITGTMTPRRFMTPSR